MSDSEAWSVDRLAAGNLLVELQRRPSSEHLELIAAHFARHRLSSCEWAAERVHSGVIKELEASSRDCFERKCAEWTDGFRCAEQVVATLRPRHLLDVVPAPARTKGQVLRALVRQTRNG